MPSMRIALSLRQSASLCVLMESSHLAWYSSVFVIPGTTSSGCGSGVSNGSPSELGPLSELGPFSELGPLSEINPMLSMTDALDSVSASATMFFKGEGL